MLQTGLLAFAVLSSALIATAQQPVWGQCGGIGWTGSTTCVAGSTCVRQNDYYYQCLPGAATTTSNRPPTTTTTTTGPSPPTTTTAAPGSGQTCPPLRRMKH